MKGPHDGAKAATDDGDDEEPVALPAETDHPVETVFVEEQYEPYTDYLSDEPRLSLGRRHRRHRKNRH